MDFCALNIALLGLQLWAVAILCSWSGRGLLRLLLCEARGEVVLPEGQLIQYWCLHCIFVYKIKLMELGIIVVFKSARTQPLLVENNDFTARQVVSSKKQFVEQRETEKVHLMCIDETEGTRWLLW